MARNLSAQPISTRAAVVIGVDNVKGLPGLKATDGANQVADWLRNEQFDVKLLMDTAEPVTLEKVFNAVSEFVYRDNVTMLLVYFAGHGFMANTNTEWWVLSDALSNPNNAVGFLESVGAAKLSGIPNVVFISDACRSTPQSLGVGNVSGGKIFPTRRGTSGDVDIDRFMATSAGGQAIELPVSESVARGYQGIFTASFLEAFKQPESGMILKLDQNTSVVPNRALKAYLRKEVSRRAQQKSIMEKQVPDIEVNSGDQVFIGHVLGQTKAMLEPSTVPIESVIDFALQGSGGDFSNDALTPETLSGIGISIRDVVQYSREIGFSGLTNLVASAPVPASFETGFSFSGVKVAEAFATGGGKASAFERGDLVSVDLSSDARAAGIVMRFNDGSGCLLPALRGYIGNVTVADGGIINVSYVSSADIATWGGYADIADGIRHRQSVFSAAATFGSFPIEGDRKVRSTKASAMLNDAMIENRYDPTLAIYSAYAFWHADTLEQLRGMTKNITEQLGLSLFDLELLSGNGVPRNAMPFFPMLAQGWELVRVYEADSEAIQRLRPHLRKSTWTTFDQGGIDLLLPMAMQNNGNLP